MLITAVLFVMTKVNGIVDAFVILLKKVQVC